MQMLAIVWSTADEWTGALRVRTGSPKAISLMVIAALMKGEFASYYGVHREPGDNADTLDPIGQRSPPRQAERMEKEQILFDESIDPIVREVSMIFRTSADALVWNLKLEF